MKKIQISVDVFFFLCYCRSKEHASDKSPNLPGAVMGWHCPGLNYHSSSS